jgi:hypothetical protein
MDTILDVSSNKIEYLSILIYFGRNGFIKLAPGLRRFEIFARLEERLR